jgi:hypothetical protein
MAKNPEFHKLLEPFHIGKVKTRNRIIKAASGTSFWNPGEHRVTEKGKAFYEALAKGGVGLIIVESPIVEYPFDEPGDVRLRIDDDKHIQDISEIAGLSINMIALRLCSSTIGVPGSNLMRFIVPTSRPRRSGHPQLNSICMARQHLRN